MDGLVRRATRSPRWGTTGQLPLEGARVIDLGVVLAGPLAAMALGDLGAEVVRVESTRRFPAIDPRLPAQPTKKLLANCRRWAAAIQTATRASTHGTASRCST